MEKTKNLEIVSESGKRVHEESYQLNENENSEVTVRYTYDFINNDNPQVVIFQILSENRQLTGDKQTSGNYSLAGLNISNFNPNFASIYGEIEDTCKVFCPTIQINPNV